VKNGTAHAHQSSGAAILHFSPEPFQPRLSGAITRPAGPCMGFDGRQRKPKSPSSPPNVRWRRRQAAVPKSPAARTGKNIGPTCLPIPLASVSARRSPASQKASARPASGRPRSSPERTPKSEFTLKTTSRSSTLIPGVQQGRSGCQ
jgi:hypothetical protein